MLFSRSVMPRFRRSSRLALLLSLLVLLLASAQSVHELLLHHAPGEQCDLCRLTPDVNSPLPPAALFVPALTSNPAPDVVMPHWLPAPPPPVGSARAPPVV